MESGINMESIQKKILEYSKGLSGNVSLNRLFPSDFVKQWSQKPDIESLLRPVGIDCQEAFDEWHIAEGAEAHFRDTYIKVETDFYSWNDMFSAAAKLYANEKRVAMKEGTWKEESFDSGVLFDDIHVFINFTVV